MILSVAWRNIWRNKVRSTVILVAIVIGIFAGAFTWAFYEGMAQQRVRSAIITEVSHIQIHNAKYLKDPDQKYIINNSNEMLEKLKSDSNVLSVSARILVNAMVTSAHTGSGVKMVGIDPESEKKVTNLFSKVIEGHYLDGSTSRRKPIVISSSLAEKLQVKLRSNVILTFQQMNDSIVKDAFRVVGIYKTTNTNFDDLNVFVRKSDLASLLRLKDGSVHEIAIRLKDNNADLASEVNKIKGEFKNYDIQSWRDLMPEVSLVEDTMDISMIFFLAIILLGLLFGIINTMLMAVLDRTKELGMLMAVGMNRLRVFMMIILETVMLSLTGGAAGVLIATGISLLTHRSGISLAAWSKAYERLGYDTMVYPDISVKIITIVVVMVVITGIIAAIFPAIKALKLKPAEAIRIDV